VIKTAVVILLAWAGPGLSLRFLVTRRRKRFVAQLPDALNNLAGSLRAGRSIGQAMDSLSRQTADPMGRELRKIVAELRLGRALPDALADASARVGSDDFGWAVLAMQIQAEVGGNLAELLSQVAATMRARVRLRGEVKALTAEGRASAMMLVIMVPALGAVMYAVNSAYMMPLFTTTVGNIMLGVSTVMIVGGYLWMTKLVKIDA
jgi:tight adherence protein B